MVYPGINGVTGNHHRGRGGSACRPAGFTGRIVGPRRKQMANDPEERIALCHARHPDFVDSWNCEGGGGNRADHVHSRLRHERRNAVAGRALDRFLFPRRDGFALSYLCCQLQDSTERIYRAGPIRWRICLFVRCYADRADVDCVARTKPEPSIMVTIVEMPPITSPSTVEQPQSTPTETVERGLIQIDHLDFKYGTHQVLHDVDLDIPARAVTAFIGPSGCGKT